MKINRVRAHPFGCLSDKEMSFGPGMNVVLGANEAGKSTLFLAIRHALLATTRLLKSGVAKHLTPYLPASGGDAISVDLEVATPESAGGARTQGPSSRCRKGRRSPTRPR